jgi:S1-C subfamily serine protease
MPGAAPRALKLIRGGRSKAMLALACLALLALGALVAPPSAPPPSARVEAVAPILEAQVDRRSSARVFRGVQDAGSRALRFSVAFGRPARAAGALTYPDFADPVREATLPAGFGVLVSDREVLTHVAAVGGGSDVQAQASDGTLLACRPLAYEPETGLVLLELAAPAPEAPPPARQTPVPGELVVAAARVDGRDFVAPVFIAAIEPDRYLISAASGVTLPGTPVYTLDGEPLAVAAGRAALPVAYPASASVDRLRRRVAEGRAFPSSIGARLQPLEAALAERLGTGGALISDVLPGSPAERAQLRPGDVLLRVAGAELGGVEDAVTRLSRLSPGSEAILGVRRDGKEREVGVVPTRTVDDPREVPARTVPAGAPLAGALFDGEALRAAGVPADAAVLAIAGGSVTTQTAAARLRRRPAPWLVYLQEGGRRFFAVVGAAS